MFASFYLPSPQRSSDPPSHLEFARLARMFDRSLHIGAVGGSRGQSGAARTIERSRLQVFAHGRRRAGVVLPHGVLMNGSLWDNVVDGLRDDFRCII